MRNFQSISVICSHQMPDFSAKMHEIQFRLGHRPRPRWGILQRSPRHPSWWGRGLLPPPKNPTPALGPFIGPRQSLLPDLTTLAPKPMPLSSSSHLLKQLHWLPIDWRIRFKLSTLTLKICIQVARNTSPIYCTSINPSRSMRSPYTQLLTLPRHNFSFGSRAFRISAPKNWNTSSSPVTLHI